MVVAWIMGIHMDLDFNTLETTSLALSIIVTTFTLQVRIFMSQKLPLSTFGDNSFEHYKLLLVPNLKLTKMVLKKKKVIERGKANYLILILTIFSTSHESNRKW